MKPETEAWVDAAEIDFRLTERVAAPPDPIFEGVCYHAQQCIEKYLKAMLEEAGRPIPRTHDLGALLSLAIDLLPDLSSLTDSIETIAPYAVVARYPGWASSIDDLAEEAESARRTMNNARSVVRSTLGLPTALGGSPCEA